MDINRKIAAEISWSRTADRSAHTRPAREAFLRRFEGEVDPDGVLPPEEHHRRAGHAKRASMLRLAKRVVQSRGLPKSPGPRDRRHTPTAITSRWLYWQLACLLRCCSFRRVGVIPLSV